MKEEISLRPEQVADLAFYMANPRCMNLSDPGTGKTPSVCVYLYWLWSTLKIRSVWAMPKSLLKKNLDEMLRFSDLKPEDVVIVDGTKIQRGKQMRSDAKVFLMGFDAFSTNWEELLQVHPDIRMLCVDEIHIGYGGPESGRTLQMFEAMKHIPYFLAMTGTIVNGRLSSVYPCLHVIAPDLYPYGFEQFDMKHSIKDSYGRTVAWVNTGPISKFLGTYGIRHTFAEVYGAESKVVLHEKCQMDPEQRKYYDEFEQTALLELEDSWLDGSLPGVNLIRCRQIMEHPQNFGPPLDKIKVTGKEQRLQIHLQHSKDTGEPLLIFAALVLSQERIVELCQKAKLRVGLINGGVSQKRRVEIDEAFRAGELDVVVASPATAAVGFNWGHVDKIVFMSLDYMDSSFVQGYRRAIRGKRETPLLIYVMEYEFSVDQKIFEIVEKKSKLASDVDDTNERLDLRQTGRKRSNMKPEGAKLSMEDFT